MQSHTITDINKEIMQIHDNLSVLEKRRITELVKLEQEMYKFITQEIQVKLIIYTQGILVSLLSKLKNHQPIEKELELLQDAQIRETSNKILGDIKKTYRELTVTKKLHSDTTEYIAKIIDL